MKQTISLEGLGSSVLPTIYLPIFSRSFSALSMLSCTAAGLEPKNCEQQYTYISDLSKSFLGESLLVQVKQVVAICFLLWAVKSNGTKAQNRHRSGKHFQLLSSSHGLAKQRGNRSL